VTFSGSGSPARNEHYKFTLRENSKDVKYRIPSSGIVADREKSNNSVKRKPPNIFNKKHNSIQSSNQLNEDSLFMVGGTQKDISMTGGNSMMQQGENSLDDENKLNVRTRTDLTKESVHMTKWQTNNSREMSIEH